jgi:hypothetical protein
MLLCELDSPCSGYGVLKKSYETSEYIRCKVFLIVNRLFASQQGLCSMVVRLAICFDYNSRLLLNKCA